MRAQVELLLPERLAGIDAGGAGGAEGVRDGVAFPFSLRSSKAGRMVSKAHSWTVAKVRLHLSLSPSLSAFMRSAPQPLTHSHTHSLTHSLTSTAGCARRRRERKSQDFSRPDIAHF